MKLLALIDIPDNDYIKQDAYWYLTGDNLQLKYIDKNKVTTDLSKDLEYYKQINDVIELEELPNRKFHCNKEKEDLTKCSCYNDFVDGWNECLLAITDDLDYISEEE